MADFERTRTATEWRDETVYYRRPPGPWWLLGLLLVPLALAGLGWSLFHKAVPSVSMPSAPSVSVPSVSVPSVTAPSVSMPSVSVPSVSVPSVSVPSVSVPAGTGACATLAADVTGLLTAPVEFETDGYTLTGGAQQMLSAVADKLKACPDAKVAVTGYTDNTGNDAINIPLSGNRATSVANYLEAQGVPAGEITAKGMGAASPVAGNDTDAGRAKNRRVEIAVS